MFQEGKWFFPYAWSGSHLNKPKSSVYMEIACKVYTSVPSFVYDSRQRSTKEPPAVAPAEVLQGSQLASVSCWSGPAWARPPCSTEGSGWTEAGRVESTTFVLERRFWDSCWIRECLGRIPRGALRGAQKRPVGWHVDGQLRSNLSYRKGINWPITIWVIWPNIFSSSLIDSISHDWY